MAESFVVYIDESGDEGFAFAESSGQGSSRWFVLSAVITRASADLETVRLVDEVRNTLGKEQRIPLHFRNLKHEHRVPFVARIAEARVRVVSVLVHKPSLQEPETFQARYVLYKYATRYLLERVSWCCRDNRLPKDSGDGSAKVVFSNRAGMSYADIREYLDYLEKRTGFLDVRIEWDVIKPDQVKAYPHGERMGLQIADAVASSFYKGVEAYPFGFTEPRYARILKPVVYQHRGRYLGNGLKFWPQDAHVLEQTQAGLEWINEVYT
ncbi:MAG: DUF3800 domain-containing protein [Phycisphaerales bacterium]|nr:MAG: DUF3800 domain-containing protein [Phycisphaerales bacterium]